MRILRTIVTTLATCCVLVGGLLVSAAPALAAAPEVISESASGVTPFEAHLEATVNASEETTECHFQYGETSVIENEAECEQGNELEGGEQGVGLTVTGLEPATTYHYRIVLRNTSNEEAMGTKESFTTLALEKPGVISEGASGVTASGARLEATVNPDYQTTSCVFEYRKHGAATFEPSVNCEPETLEGGEQGVSVSVTGLELGTTYDYRIVLNNATGETTVEDHFTTIGRPPVTTGEAANITRTTATLAGTVDPEGAETTYYFEYVTVTDYNRALTGDSEEKADPYLTGESTTPLSAGSSDEPQAIGPIQATGLLPEETYYYRLVASNEAGVEYGQPRTLKAASRTPPIVSTGGVSGVGQATATLSGLVTTNSLQTEYGFEIVTEPGDYGPATGLGSLGGTTTKTVTLSLSELQPGTTYYYRVTATNADGTSYGEPESFTTVALPTLFTIPAAPAQIGTPAIEFPASSEANTGTTTKAKKLTRAQKLNKALKACVRKPKKQRASCRKRAHKKYALAKKKR